MAKRILFYWINTIVTTLGVTAVAIGGNPTESVLSVIGIFILTAVTMIGWTAIGSLVPFSRVERDVPHEEVDRVRAGILLPDRTVLTDYDQVVMFDQGGRLIETIEFSAYGFENDREYRVVAP